MDNFEVAIKNNIKDVNVDNVLASIRTGMILAERFVDGNGEKKKELVLQGVLAAVNNSNLSEEQQKAISSIIENIGPMFIDEIVSAAKKAYDFGQKNCYCC